jgi:putative restriction endonuclease
MEEQDLLNKFKNLNVNRSGDRRAPHKPLLVLIAIAKLRQGQSKLRYADATSILLPLLRSYAPPVQGSHQPELPYWHLQGDGIWEVSDADSLPRQSGNFPRIGALRETEAGFSQKVIDALVQSPKLTGKIVQKLLEQHFPTSIHDDLIAQVGLEDLALMNVEESDLTANITRTRDPSFRVNVLRAYEYRCAVTGFQAAIGGAFFGCEAAHVRWHAYDGPDILENGICLEPTLHKLFDVGAWTLTDDRRIVVSKDFTGSETALTRLRENHGRQLSSPIQGEALVSVEFIRWHREPQLGGVFRLPAMGL